MRRALKVWLGSVLVLGVLAQPSAAQPSHPLDPLTWQEHWTVLEVLRDAGHLDSTTRFSQVRLAEPDKQQVWRFQKGASIERRAFAVVRQGKDAFEATIDLGSRQVLSWQKLEGAHANWLTEEFGGAVAEAMKHPDFVAGLAKRGIEDLTFVDCVAIPPGYFGTKAEKGRRLGHVRCVDPRGVRNTWARQIEGLTAVVDLDTQEVLEVVDEGAPPLHSITADFDATSLGPPRTVPSPILVDQPLGPGFAVDGHVVEWQNWRFHFRLDQRVGTVISTVTYRDAGSETAGESQRSVLYQGHLSEVFVPYMDPGFAWHGRNFIDAGEFSGTGLFQPLVAGSDCPDHAVYFDTLQVLPNGRPSTVSDVVCLFEREAGEPSWRHAEDSLRESRPKRDLVVRSAAVIGNYDYLFDWVFQQDGSIRGAVGATGIVEVKMVAESGAFTRTAGLEPSTAAADATTQTRADAYGRFVDPHIVATNHDHYFSYRLDLDVDGESNDFVIDRLVQKRLDGERRKSIWVREARIAQRESEAQLDINYDRPALWRVASPSRTNHVGYPTSYQLMPGMTANTLLSDDDYPRRRAGFINHHLWVTPYHKDERYAAGEHPTLSEPGMGLPAWTSDNRWIARSDVVLWYTIGMHHMVRAEDWPVMPVMWHSFELRPFDFFDHNPALDLPAKR